MKDAIAILKRMNFKNDDSESTKHQQWFQFSEQSGFAPQVCATPNIDLLSRLLGNTFQERL
jgi:hypothetical protein